jgi:rhamnosyltransferase
MSTTKRNICAVIITHNPDEKFEELLLELEKQVNLIVVVDNASSPTNLELITRAEQLPDIFLIRNSRNMGVAAALNQGFEKSIESGYLWTITFDQDSKPQIDLIEKLWKLLQNQTEPSEISILAPQIIDIASERSSRFLQRKFSILYQRRECKEAVLSEVTTVITNGAMIRNSTFKVLGGFRENFFIDYVDTEFCLRLLSKGYRIFVACDAKLLHTFGNRKKKPWGPFIFYPTFHPPERWYTISRNRIQMIKSYGLRFPHWLSYELVATCYITIRMLLTENQRFAKLSALVRGTWDGFRGKLGIPYWAIEQANTMK